MYFSWADRLPAVDPSDHYDQAERPGLIHDVSDTFEGVARSVTRSLSVTVARSPTTKVRHGVLAAPPGRGRVPVGDLAVGTPGEAEAGAQVGGAGPDAERRRLKDLGRTSADLQRELACRGQRHGRGRAAPGRAELPLLRGSRECR